MKKQQNNIFWLKLNGLLRTLLAHTCCNDTFGFYLVNEYPKSGGSWLGQMLAEALDLPFSRNRLPMLKPSILHGHYYHPGNIQRSALIWRDGRDILVSQYYHYLFENERGNAYGVKLTRNALRFSDYNDIRANLPEFMRYMYEYSKHPGFSWSDFVSKWWNNEAVSHVKYEDLRHNTIFELQRLVFELTGAALSDERACRIANEYSFEKQSKRTPGLENINSFMRKGIVGDWRNHFTREARERFAEYAGDQLIKLGYENSYDWVADDA